MPSIQAFRGLRYDLGHVGALSDVIAPPYDVIDEQLQDELYAKSDYNCVRLILNKMLPTDDEANNRYTRAAKTLKAWKDEGVLTLESQPAIYVYTQEYEYAGKKILRKGFMAGLQVQRFGEGMVFPHELTHAAAKADRLMLTTTTKTNLSQIFGLYPDPKNEVQTVLDKAVAAMPPLEATDHLGVVHRMWVVTDGEVIAKVVSLMGDKPVFIADGHHRYETACNYRDHIAQTFGGSLPADHPAQFVLSMFVAMDDPGLLVLPTHRLFPNAPEFDQAELMNALGDCFTLEETLVGTDSCFTMWEDLETGGDQSRIALYTKKDDKWSLVKLTDAGKAKIAEVTPDHNEDWQALGVSILHKLICETLLKMPPAAEVKPTYVHLVSEVDDGLKTGKFPMAALVMPATVDNIKTLCIAGERMPQKSTYFYPKLLSGLVFKPVE